MDFKGVAHPVNSEDEDSQPVTERVKKSFFVGHDAGQDDEHNGQNTGYTRPDGRPPDNGKKKNPDGFHA
jgi:hypothetical protein